MAAEEDTQDLIYSVHIEHILHLLRVDAHHMCQNERSKCNEVRMSSTRIKTSRAKHTSSMSRFNNPTTQQPKKKEKEAYKVRKYYEQEST